MMWICIMLYVFSRKCCIIMQMQAVRTSFFFLSILSDTRRETQFLRAYANHSMLIPLHAVVVSKISTPVETKTDLLWFNPKNSNAPFNGRTSTDCLFKLQKFSGPSLPGATSSTHSIHSNGYPDPFPVWGFIMTDNDCHIPSVGA